MSLANKSLSPEVQMRVQNALNQTDWVKEFPDQRERLTKFRAAKEKIVARVLTEQTTKQASEADAAAREARAWLARWTNPGGRYGQ